MEQSREQELLEIARIIEKRLTLLEQETPKYEPFPCASFLPELKKAIARYEVK